MYLGKSESVKQRKMGHADTWRIKRRLFLLDFLS